VASAADARPRIAVFGYHDVGYACLDALLARGERVVAVFTHADDPKEQVWFRSVEKLARAHGIPVHTPDAVTTPEWIARVRALQPELLFSFYYRHMLPQPILDLPRLGAFNLHGSLLPKYRGRVPINWAVLHGERETGATLHYMVRRADAGDIVDQERVPIGPEDTAHAVFGRVVGAARAVLERQLDNLKRGSAPRRPQDEAQASYFGARRPEDGRIDWTRDARSLFNLIRAVTHPYPGAFTEVDGRRLYIWWARPVEGRGAAGEVLSAAPLRIAAGRGALEIVTLQWQDGGEETADKNTHGLRTGQRLGTGYNARPAQTANSDARARQTPLPPGEGKG